MSFPPFTVSSFISSLLRCRNGNDVRTLLGMLTTAQVDGRIDLRAVEYVAQTLTDGQKLQAKINLGLASPATFYFYSASGTLTDAALWFSDADCTIQTHAVPTIGTGYVTAGSVVTGTSDMGDLNVEFLGGSGDVYGAVLTGDLTCANPVVFGGLDYVSQNQGNINGVATFNDFAANSGTVGAATFNDFAANYGTVDGAATFNDNSRNPLAGTVGAATFNDFAANYGTVDSYATFNDGGTNLGITNYYYGHTTFNGGGYNTADGVVCESATFNGYSYNDQGTVTGDATFNDNSENRGPLGSTATFGGASVNTVYGSIAGTVFFGGGSHNLGTLSGSSSVAFGGNSVNGGTITRDSTSFQDCATNGSPGAVGNSSHTSGISFSNAASNAGSVNGRITVYFPSAKTIGGTVVGGSSVTYVGNYP